MGVFHANRTRSYCLKQPTGNAWPKHVACFHVKATYDGKPQTTLDLRQADLACWGVLQGWEQWHNSELLWNNDRPSWLSGDEREQFWKNLICRANTCGTLWVWAWNVWPAWCLLDGVKEVSEGRLILDVRHDSGDGNLPGKSPRRPSGLFVAENPPTIICLAVPGGGRIKIIDLANYGIEPEDYGITGDGGALAATVQAVKDYKRLCDVYDLGSCQTTAASQSWYAYRRSHMATPVICHPIEKVLDLERAAYYGGRCECTRLGRWSQPMFHLDVNSMYASIGLLAKFPYKYVASWEPSIAVPERPYFQDMAIIADVTVKTDTPHYPARENVKKDALAPPVKRGGRERVIYPVGEFRTALCGPELHLAMYAGHITQWHRVQYYEQAPLMKSWSKFALNMRATLGDHGLSHLKRCCKKIINSLPGKWGQKQKTWVDVTLPGDPEDIWSDSGEWLQEWGKHPKNGGITVYRTIAGRTQYQESENLCATSCPSVAAFWTAYGRIMLLSLIQLAHWENVYYYDTDSLVVDQAGYDRLMHAGCLSETNPGMLKLKEQSDDVEILGIRRYRFGSRWCVAGPFGGQVSGESPSPVWTEHEGFGGQLWHRNVGDPVRRVIKASWRKAYHHGVVDKDGAVHPFHVPCLLPPETSDPIL